MDSVPEKFRMVGFDGTASINIAALNLANLGVIAHSNEAGAKTMLGTCPARRFGIPRHPNDRQGFRKRSRQRPTDVKPFTRLQNLGRLFQMLAPIEAHNHHCVAALKQFIHRADQSHIKLGDLGFPFGQIVHAFGNVGACRGRIGGNNPNPGQIPDRLGVIEELGKGNRLKLSSPSTPTRTGPGVWESAVPGRINPATTTAENQSVRNETMVKVSLSSEKRGREPGTEGIVKMIGLVLV